MIFQNGHSAGVPPFYFPHSLFPFLFPPSQHPASGSPSPLAGEYAFVAQMIRAAFDKGQVAGLNPAKGNFFHIFPFQMAPGKDRRIVCKSENTQRTREERVHIRV